jgi:hypothetical protein
MGIQILNQITLLIFIPDAGTDFSPSQTPDPGSQLPDPGPASKNFNLLSQKMVYNLYKIVSGYFNPDPKSGY